MDEGVEGVHQPSQSYIDLWDLHPYPWGKGSRPSQPGDSARLNLVSINTYQGHRELTARCLISSSNTSGIVEVHEKSDLFISGKTCISSTGGSVVEFSPATREARVRFPASARISFFSPFFLITLVYLLIFAKLWFDMNQCITFCPQILKQKIRKYHQERIIGISEIHQSYF